MEFDECPPSNTFVHTLSTAAGIANSVPWYAKNIFSILTIFVISRINTVNAVKQLITLCKSAPMFSSCLGIFGAIGKTS